MQPLTGLSAVATTGCVSQVRETDLGTMGDGGAPKPEGPSQPGPPLPLPGPTAQGRAGCRPRSTPSPWSVAPACPPGSPQQVSHPHIPTGPSGFLLSPLPRSPPHWPSSGSPAGPASPANTCQAQGCPHLNLGCREIAGAVGPQGDIHPEANLGPAFPTCSASCQALGPPGPCRPHPVPRAPWCPVGGGPVEGERLPRAGQPGWGEAGRRSLQGGLLQELLPHNPPRPSL